MLCAVSFWHTARRRLPPGWWGVLLGVNHSAVLMELLPGSLASRYLLLHILFVVALVVTYASCYQIG